MSRAERNILEFYDATGPTISPEYGPHLQTYMVAVSSRVIQVVGTLWDQTKLSQELVLKRLYDHNVTVGNLEAVGAFLKRGKTGKHLSIAQGELGLSFVLLSNGKKLHAMCFDGRTLGGAGEARNPTACFKDQVPPKCLDTNVTNVSSEDCHACPQLEPNKCMFVKFGGDIVKNDLLSPWISARVSELDVRALGYRLSFK